jgi:hypothetical protein
MEKDQIRKDNLV